MLNSLLKIETLLKYATFWLLLFVKSFENMELWFKNLMFYLKTGSVCYIPQRLVCMVRNIPAMLIDTKGSPGAMAIWGSFRFLLCLSPTFWKIDLLVPSQCSYLWFVLPFCHPWRLMPSFASSTGAVEILIPGFKIHWPSTFSVWLLQSPLHPGVVGDWLGSWV